MAVFSYTAKDAKKKTIKGQIVAENEASLSSKLQAMGLTLTSSTTETVGKKNLSGWFEEIQGVPVVQKIFFTQNLGVMLRGGFSIGRAMGTLALQTNHKYFKKIILNLQDNLESGQTFAQSLKKYPRVFPELFINMVAAGEASGKLDEVLKSLTHQMKKDFALVSKVKGAMTYPIIVVVAMVGAAVAMITLVIPKLQDVFNQNGGTLPLPTRILIAISDSLIHHWIWYIVGIIAVTAAIIFTGRTTKGKWAFDAFFLRAPIAGPIVKKINIARFTRSLSSMLATDIPIIQTFQIIGRTLSSAHYRKSVEDAAQALRTGVSIGKVLERYPMLYPPLIQQMVAVGEESGTLDEVSGDLATFFEEEVDQTMSNLSTIIEPILLLVLGVGVASMALAIMLPIYGLSNQIS